MPRSSRPRDTTGDIASLLQRFDALLEALRPALAEDPASRRDEAPSNPASPAAGDREPAEDGGSHWRPDRH